MFLLLAVAGFVMLIAIIWCVRMMRKGHTTLALNKERWHEHFREEESRLSKEQKEITVSEQLTLVHAAINDLLRLDNRTDATCELSPKGIRLLAGTEEFTISLESREQRLASMKKVLHSPARWTLTTPHGSLIYTRIDDMMKALVLALRGDTDELKAEKAFLESSVRNASPKNGNKHIIASSRSSSPR